MTKETILRNTIGSKESICLFFLLLFFLIIKVFFLMYAKPLPDEAYYWLWSKNVALSYFDHPPLVAWFQAFLLSFSDNKYVAIRALPVISLGFVLAIIIVWQRIMFKRFNFGLCLKTIVLFL